MAEPRRAAIISADQKYRYALVRDGLRDGTPGHQYAGRTVAFLMLNPSTADAQVDDPTIRRCMGFARTWGYDKLVVGNLFAYRATDPADLPDDDEAVGPENLEWLRRLVHESTLVIAAWGASPKAAARAEEVNFHIPMHCLGLTKSGAPRHPLYVRADTKPTAFSG